MKQRRKNLSEVLVESGMVTRGQLREAARNRQKGQKASDLLLAGGYITERQLIDVLESKMGIPYVSLSQTSISKQAMTYVSHDYAQKNYIMPIKADQDVLTVAMRDPLNYYMVDNLQLSSGLTIRPVVATKDDILQTVNRYYVHGSDGGSSGGDQSAVKLFNQLIVTGFQFGASDVHIDPGERDIAVRYRIDGQLHTDRKIRKDMMSELIARIKILANLDITQTRLPQDGRFKTTIDGSPVDMRIAILPTVNGEKVVLRILDTSTAFRRINELGFSKSNFAKYKELLHKPSGLMLVTGPTGSGKSSTLYASIQHLNQDNVNMMTIEDPVELEMEGVNQVQVNAETGMTFAAGLRSILRQDPNVIMVGEIRDQETAEIAIRSALTGHLVFSTLHTNNAVDAIPRLVDMGVAPYLVSSSMKGVIAQRLVRRICGDCKYKRKVTDAEQQMFADRGLSADYLCEGKGCDSCGRTGYRGRTPVHEIVMIDDEMKRMLLSEGSNADFHGYVYEQGMEFLIDDGLGKAKAGVTSMNEVMQIIADT